MKMWIVLFVKQIAIVVSATLKKNKNTYLRDRTVCKSCYNKNRRKNNNNNNDDDKKKIKDDDSVNNINRTIIIGFSNCGKTFSMNHIQLLKQEPFFIITKSLNQYPNIKAQTSDEIQPSTEHENSTVVFDDKLLSKQESNIDLFFTRGRHNKTDIYCTSQS